MHTIQFGLRRFVISDLYYIFVIDFNTHAQATTHAMDYNWSWYLKDHRQDTPAIHRNVETIWLNQIACVQTGSCKDLDVMIRNEGCNKAKTGMNNETAHGLKLYRDEQLASLKGNSVVLPPDVANYAMNILFG
eukprot:636265_1